MVICLFALVRLFGLMLSASVPRSSWIQRILLSGRLCGGEAGKLAGALQWAAQHTFRRLGRAMIRPLIRQEKKRSSLLDDELTLALQWWLEVLQLGLTQKRTWEKELKRPVHLFCDARSTPPRVAAVLVRCVLFAPLRVCRARSTCFGFPA